MRLFALLASALACTGLVTACPGGFNLGTTTAGSDVINNCFVTPGWSGGVVRTDVKPAVHGLYFYARSTAAQSYTLTVVANDDRIVIPIARQGQSGIIVPNVDTTIFIDLPCVNMDGRIYETDVTATFSFTNPASSDISFQFHKICELPPINVGSPGPAGLDPDIAVEGVPRSDFNYTSTPDVTSDIFTLWIPSNIDYYYWPYFNFSEQPIVRWTNKNLITSVSYALSSQSILPNTTTNPLTRLTISYTCNNAISSGSDTIYVIFDIGFLQKLQFQYTKNCSYTQRIAIADVFNAQLVRTNEYAITGGVPKGDWSNGFGHNIPQNEHEVDFWVYITGSTRFGQTELPFNVTTQVTNGITHMAINNGNQESQSYVARMINAPGYKNNVTVPVDLTCLSTGDATGMVTFDFGQQYDKISIRFQYYCSQPYFNIDFLATDGQTVIQRIVSKNIPQFWNYTSPASALTERFVVTLDESTTYPVQDITFDKVSYLNHALNPQVIPTNSWMPLSKTNNITATIIFNCIDNGQYSVTPLTIQVDYGWNVVQKISFRKICDTPAPSPAPSSSSSGWSAAGIFFFTIFILTLVGCVTGAGYKYVKEDKRGWEMIPGITYYRSCYENACPTKRYTPQTDYYTDNVPDHGGKSYQTDL